MVSSIGPLFWACAGLYSFAMANPHSIAQTPPRDSKQSAIHLTLIATREELREEVRPLLDIRDRRKLETASRRIGVAIVDLGDLGVIIEDGDPLGIAARAAKVVMLREVSAMMASGRGWIRVDEFSDSAKKELESVVAELAAHLGFRAPKDSSKVPLAFGIGASVALKHGDKLIQIPLAPPDPSDGRPEPASIPVADRIKPEDVPAETAKLNVPKSLRFHTAASQTAIAARLNLVRAYCELQAPRAEALFQEWNSLADELGKRQGSASDYRGKKLADIPHAERQRIESDVIYGFARYGFGSRAEAESFLQGASITDHLRYVKIQLSLGMPNGVRTGGSFPIHP